MKRNILYGFICLLVLGTSACRKDIFDELVTQGESTVTATVEFKPMRAALASTKTAGNAIKRIESLCVLLYDANQNLVDKRLIADFTESEEERESETEARTPRATFSLKVPYGRYYAYAVANMGDLSAYDVRTVKGLQNISLVWQNTVSANNQMFGHFTLENEIRDKAPLLTVNRKNMALHAWIRRAASKVTVAYDGSALEEGVFIFIKSVQIKDIPKTCLLGADNTPTSRDQLTADGETITYGEGTSYDENWPARITKGRPYYPHDDAYELSADAHAETADALFFYENMQGEGKDKTQSKEFLGENAVDKDDKPCGTYIEVKAYYRSLNEERVGSGNIVYRFMLGKNTTTDYDAQRNYHYKLTLKFKRFANDADWHIDYKEEIPSIQLPEPYYISYLYNHSMTMPVKVNGGSYEITEFSARIDTNAWAPHNAPQLDYWKALDPEVTPGAPLNLWNGFLSLRRTKATVIAPGYDGGINTCDGVNREYYETNQRGERSYAVTPGSYDDDVTGDGHYTVEKETDEEGRNILTFKLPMYTRAKQLITTTGYTGNNPFVAYQRKAVVRFTATLKGNGETKQIVKDATIMQVRRVVNPKGVWRKHDSRKPFRVVLKRLPRESATEFQTFTSEGRWKAYVVRGDADFITLDGGKEAKGSTGTPIDFTIGFTSTCRADESRCAIIRVEYHDYSCYHLIFVRQGKSPLQLLGSGRKWHACNMRTATREGDCPLEEGSLFRFGNWDQPIDAVSNVNDSYPLPWVNVSETSFKDHSDTPLQIAGTDQTSLWKDIAAQTNDGRFSDPTLEGGGTVSVATYDDFNALFNNDVIEQGYGVLYGDDATTTLDKIEEVYGHRHDTHGEGQTSGAGYGMRGVFVYNTSENTPYSGNHIFFPLGTSGYGHRKQTRANEVGNAVLRYSSGRAAPKLDNVEYSPLFYDLYMRPGAIYWLKEKSGKIIGWDFNYFTFDFNGLPYSNLFQPSENAANASDACFVRCVEN